MVLEVGRKEDEQQNRVREAVKKVYLAGACDATKLFRNTEETLMKRGAISASILLGLGIVSLVIAILAQSFIGLFCSGFLLGSGLIELSEFLAKYRKVKTLENMMNKLENIISKTEATEVNGKTS